MTVTNIVRNSPGPWDIDPPDNDDERCWLVQSPNLTTVATVWTSEADANLIAAAPGLLAVVRDLLALLEGAEEFDGGDYAEAHAARDVIAKAEGRS